MTNGSDAFPVGEPAKVVWWYVEGYAWDANHLGEFAEVGMVLPAVDEQSAREHYRLDCGVEGYPWCAVTKLTLLERAAKTAKTSHTEE